MMYTDAMLGNLLVLLMIAVLFLEAIFLLLVYLKRKPIVIHGFFAPLHCIFSALVLLFAIGVPDIYGPSCLTVFLCGLILIYLLCTGIALVKEYKTWHIFLFNGDFKHLLQETSRDLNLTTTVYPEHREGKYVVWIEEWKEEITVQKEVETWIWCYHKSRRNQRKLSEFYKRILEKSQEETNPPSINIKAVSVFIILIGVFMWGFVYFLQLLLR
ncbi:MAG: hypothetical protein PHI40_03470 [Caldisericia bacterium]|nr:hypothetical protein [Caldisericia bacterium]